MLKTHMLAAVAVGALSLSGASAQAQPGRMSPAQSLGGSCRDVQSLNSGYVTGVCRDNQGRERWSSVYYPQCRSEISNRDGMIACAGAPTNGGQYVQDNSGQQVAAAVIGAVASAIFGDNNTDSVVSGRRSTSARPSSTPASTPGFGTGR